MKTEGEKWEELMDSSRELCRQLGQEFKAPQYQIGLKVERISTNCERPRNGFMLAILVSIISEPACASAHLWRNPKRGGSENAQ